MATRSRKGRRVVEAPPSDSDSSELSYVSDEEDQSLSRVGASASSSKAKGKGKQVESSSPAPVRKKPKTGDGKAAAGATKKKQDLSLLFTMPLDILAEVCSHLHPRDLINVCRTSKIFRTFLLSRNSRSVWSASRAQAGFPALQHIKLSPMQYALNLFGRGMCETCELTRAEPIYALMIRQCKECRQEILVTKGNNLKRELPDLHPRAFECTPGPEVKSYRNAWRAGKPMWRKDHILEASDRLEELEAEDAKETEERRILELRAKGGGRNTRRANKAVSDSLDLNRPHTDRVGTYIAEQKKWAKGCIAEEAKIWKVFDDEQAERARLASEAMARHSAAEAAKQQQIRADLLTIGWTQAEVDGWQQYGRAWSVRFGGNPKGDKKGWEVARKLVNDRLAEERVRAAKLAEERALKERQRQRKALISPYYDTLLAAEPDATVITFPRRNAFLELPSVKVFWELDEDDGGEKLTPKSWKKHSKLVKQGVKASVESVRIETIRKILAASRNVDISTLPSKPSKYPDSIYDDKFFKKVTSGSLRMDWSWQAGNVVQLVYYPDFLALNPGGPYTTPFRTTALRVSTLRSILEAADLDEDTATEDDLDKLGNRLRWLEYPVYKKSKATRSWKNLILEVERCKRRQHRNLTVTIVLDEAPDAGTAQQPASDDEDELEEEESEEEQEEKDSEAGSSSAVGARSRRRRAQQGDDDEDEDEDNGEDSQMGEGGAEMDAEEQEGAADQLGDEGEGEDQLESDEE
ncbi:hypothetical protein BCR35DRAFT_302965 [Leucosporidium creatinivorum]|uniref:F-box domain-containing protein n=1 Tax=Leucosporidium creatinivorum TaxID=106004 RepID=A0A1Y2FL19_9BASI|nr:hypothetical protein BCR35DRAFT_302965 [Leucosporidium creatinivorum]